MFFLAFELVTAAVGDGRAADQKATPLVKTHRTGA